MVLRLFMMALLLQVSAYAEVTVRASPFEKQSLAIQSDFQKATGVKLELMASTHQELECGRRQATQLIRNPEVLKSRDIRHVSIWSMALQKPRVLVTSNQFIEIPGAGVFSTHSAQRTDTGGYESPEHYSVAVVGEFNPNEPSFTYHGRNVITLAGRPFGTSIRLPEGSTSSVSLQGEAKAWLSVICTNLKRMIERHFSTDYFEIHEVDTDLSVRRPLMCGLEVVSKARYPTVNSLDIVPYDEDSRECTLFSKQEISSAPIANEDGK